MEASSVAWWIWKVEYWAMHSNQQALEQFYEFPMKHMRIWPSDGQHLEDPLTTLFLHDWENVIKVFQYNHGKQDFLCLFAEFDPLYQFFKFHRQSTGTIKMNNSEIIMVSMSKSWVHKHMKAYIYTSTPTEYSVLYAGTHSLVNHKR